MTINNKSITNGLDLNNQVLLAQFAGGGKPNANYNKIFRISRELTVEVWLVLYENGIVSFTGIDKEGLQTLSFSSSPHSDQPAESFGDDWKDKIVKAQSYNDKQLLDIAQVKERLSVSEIEYPEITRTKPISSFKRI